WVPPARSTVEVARLPKDALVEIEVIALRYAASFTGRIASNIGEQFMEKVEKTDAEWRAELTPEQYYVMRQKGTEPAFSGALYRNHADGTYRWAACGAELFSSATKFESGSGWPSFSLPANAEDRKS